MPTRPFDDSAVAQIPWQRRRCRPRPLELMALSDAVATTPPSPRSPGADGVVGRGRHGADGVVGRGHHNAAVAQIPRAVMELMALLAVVATTPPAPTALSHRPDSGLGRHNAAVAQIPWRRRRCR